MAPQVPGVRLRRSHTASRARIRPSSIIVFAQRPFQEDRSRDLYVDNRVDRGYLVRILNRVGFVPWRRP
jgi:hypothetical protein